jgi:methionyl-tRNA formyltransferase
MKYQNVAILTSRESWFVPYTKNLLRILRKKKHKAALFYNHSKITDTYTIVFILSYFQLIPKSYLKKHKHNLVVHESALPKGRGWSPLFWQILNNKRKIPIVLFEASNDFDLGRVYIKDYLFFKGHELNKEIREKQASKTIDLCLRFLDEHDNIKGSAQIGISTYYRKRNSSDSNLDINKSIKDQFNLLRIVDNDKYPAFFNYRGHMYIIKIYKKTDKE